MPEFSIKRTAFAANVVWIVAAAILVGQTAGCASPYHINKQTHDDGTEDYVLFNNEIVVEGAAKYHAEFQEGNYSLDRQCFLDVRRSQHGNGDLTYGLIVRYVGSDWLTIEKGRSLELVIGINSFVFSAEGDLDRQKDPTGNFVTETLDYPVSSDILRRLTDADKVDVIVTGRAGEVRGYFDDRNFANIRRFVHEYVGTAETETPPK